MPETTSPERRGASGFARRSDRISLAVPIEVRGTDAAGVSFVEKTRTQVISRYGALILLRHRMAPDRKIILRCVGTGVEAPGRVTAEVGKDNEGYWYGVEVPDPEVNLWAVDFPTAAESELAAARLLLECMRCQASEVAYLTLLDVEIFAKHKSISRPCRRCNDVTLWAEAQLRHLLPVPGPLTVDAPAGQETPEAPPRTENERFEGRIQLSLKGCVKTDQYGEEPVTTENVSETGACFKSAKRYPGGATVAVAIPYSPGRANVFVLARITWSRYRAAEKRTVYGLCYLHARRRAKRVKPTTIVRVGAIGGGFRLVGTVVDVSMTGVLVRCSEQIEAGAAVRLGIEAHNDTIRMSGTAKRSVPGVGMAFEFNQMANRDRSLLRRLILRLEKQRGM